MPRSQFELGSLRLGLPKLGLHASTSAVITTAGTAEDNEHVYELDSPSLERGWLCRGRNLCLEISISVDGRPIEFADVRSLENSVCGAEVTRRYRPQ